MIEVKRDIKKYKARILVEYEFNLENIGGIDEEDVKHYINSITPHFFEGSEDIEDLNHMFLSELENALNANMPTATPYLSNRILKIKPSLEVQEMEIEEG